MLVNFPCMSKQIKGVNFHLYKIPLVQNGGTLYKLTVPFQQSENPNNDIELDMSVDLSQEFKDGEILRHAMYNYDGEIHSHYTGTSEGAGA